MSKYLGKRKRITLRLSEELLQKLKEESIKGDVSLNSLVVEILER